MKIRTLFIGLTLLMSFQTLSAQTMTDTQVIAYGKQRYSAGADAKTIGTELLAQGATKDQIKRLASEYQSGGTVAGATTQSDIDRSRIANGEEIPDETETEVTETRKIFGHDIFRSKLLSFEPNMSMAISPTYVLGAGDEMIIDVYGASQTSQKIQVAPDGSVTIPRIGPVNVSGMTVEQAQARIRSVMGVHYKNSSIKVSVGQTRTISISVMGEVKTPGTYTLSAFATVFHALYMAGGINDLGTLREVKVARNGRIISAIDVYEYIISGRLAGNVKLRDNDVIIVGSYENLVQVAGNVKRPMWYEMKKNESIKSLLRFCGGFTGDAYSKTVTVNRRAGQKLSVYTVEEFDFTSFKLADEDSVSVGANEQRYENMVQVQGAIKRPGQYGLTSVKTIRGLIETAGGLQEDAQTNRAVITRMNADRTRKTITVDLSGIINGTAADVALENEDVLQIASLAKLNDDRTMSIEGDVFNPGTFPYAENTTIEDLITQAGGLTISASLLNVEVSRRIIDPAASTDSIVRSETFSFNLNKDLAIEGQNDFKLKPYDQVYVRRSPVYEVQRTVNVTGEILFAGNYTLKNNETRLSDIIKEAGGLKKKASAHDARLIRTMNETEQARSKQLLEMAENSTDSLNINAIRPESTYNVGIDLEKAMENPGSSYDILLRDGDQIIIPSLITTVKISGEVLYPNNVTFIAGKKGSYYINEAGGYTKKSYKRHAYIVYANGQVSKLSKGKIEPGCEIVVPVKEHKDRSNDVMKWISICTSLTTVAAVLINVLK